MTLSSESPKKPKRNYDAHSGSDEDSQAEDMDDDENEQEQGHRSKWFNLPAIGKSKDGKSVDGKSSLGKNGSEIGVPYNPYHHLRVLMARKYPYCGNNS